MSRYIVLGRFQPFHFGHAYLVEKASALRNEGDELIVAIGSKQAEWEPNNPWSAEERVAMLTAWTSAHHIECSIVTIDDIHDPPNWVEHATIVHGKGTLVTTDEATSRLYSEGGFDVLLIEMNERERLEGWRIRQTAKMLSTVYDDEAVREVLKESIPHSVIEWLIENDALFRLSTFETGVYAG
ncbi:MAG: adenylyltransferase/cytidyltransferase family protein [Candidatus Poseidoniaceae archaeon]|nr:adenylyltransferase/cytidyltransferase family protein [Candidatus Poseidoniaceae archaeon]